MIADDFRIEMVGHATLRVQSGGRTLLTDPWLHGAIACRSELHFPPLVHDPALLAAETDAIYLSHVHPDHFHPPTLARFPKHIPVYLGAYTRKDFRDAVRRLGFPVMEAPFDTPVAVDGTDFTITIIEHDYADSAAYDSAVVIQTPQWTLFENNDCFLGPAKYAWVRERFAVDYAFLGYSPASFFPIAFELPADEKRRLLTEASERRYAAFVEAACGLTPRLAIPFASGARFLHPDALWKNVLFNSPHEAVVRLTQTGLRGDIMQPGDRIDTNGTLQRHRATESTPIDEPRAIAAYAAATRADILAVSRAPIPARPDILDQLRDTLLARWQALHDRLPGARAYVIAYVVRGTTDETCWFDFSRPDQEIFQRGTPPRYDMRYTYPADALQECLDGAISWDELHFATGVSIHQVRYAREFYLLLRSDTLELPAD